MATTIHIDDKVLVTGGPHEGCEGFVSAMLQRGIEGEIEHLMVSTYHDDGRPDDDFLAAPSEVVVTGRFEIGAQTSRRLR